MKNREALRRELQLLSKEDLIELVLHLTDRIAELEARLRKLESQNSRNSSLPPSRDRQDVKKKIRSFRKKSNP